MPFVSRISRGEVPSPSTSYILIEPVNGGRQVSGAVVVNHYTKHLSSIVHRSYDDALREAIAWSIEYGIPEIFLVGTDTDRVALYFFHVFAEYHLMDTLGTPCADARAVRMHMLALAQAACQRAHLQNAIWSIAVGKRLMMVQALHP